MTLKSRHPPMFIVYCLHESVVKQGKCNGGQSSPRNCLECAFSFSYNIKRLTNAVKMTYFNYLFYWNNCIIYYLLIAVKSIINFFKLLLCIMPFVNIEIYVVQKE
jgi:hypothetical protein